VSTAKRRSGPFNFGDIVENEFASLRNPHRLMIFISATKDKLHFTAKSDGKWSTLWFYNDTGNKLFKVGTVTPDDSLRKFDEMRTQKLAQFQDSEDKK
jgi:hypothetical protein